jgi:hypothetical protein
MTTSLKGVVHGRVVELEREPGLPDGQQVSVTLRPVSAETSPTSGAALEALRRAAGAWADDVEGLDRFLEWNRQQRKAIRRGIAE